MSVHGAYPAEIGAVAEEFTPQDGSILITAPRNGTASPARSGIMVAPLTWGTTFVGHLCIVAHPGTEFDPDAELILDILAAAAGPALRRDPELAGPDGAPSVADAARQSEKRFQQFGAASPDILWIRNGATFECEYLSPAFESIYGERPAAILGPNGLERWTELVVPEDRDSARQALQRALAGELVRFEFRIRRPSDGAIRWLRNVDFPLVEDSTVQAIGGIGRDITAEKTATEESRRLLSELQHRVRNALSVIRSIVRRTAETSETVEDLAMHLDGRLNAFARVQAAVARNPTLGIELEDLIVDELFAYAAHEGSQAKVSGPSVPLTPKAAEVLGLAVHELATNAVKHGALALPKGRVRVTWEVRPERDVPLLVLEWREKGVPGTPPTPVHRGFGTELLERTLNYELDARVSRTFEPGGIVCVVELPLTERIVVMDREGLRPRRRK